MKALLLEIKRLHGVLVEAHRLGAGLVRYSENADTSAAIDRFTELFEGEPAIVEPPKPSRGKQARPEPEQRFPHMTEREEKRLARDKRG